MRWVALFNGDLVLFDRAELPCSGRCVVATDGITPPIWFGQGSDPGILGDVSVGVHHLVDEVNCSETEAARCPFPQILLPEL
jgi:hypothetical protein